MRKVPRVASELPEGWVYTRLGEGLVVDVQPGFACGKNNREGEGIAHVRPMNVSREGRMTLSNLKYVPASEADRDERLLRTGDVVFNNTNSPELVGKTALYGHQEPRAFSNHMTRIRCCTDVLEPQYCADWLHQLWRTGYFKDICNNHVSQSSVGREVLREIEIPLAPLLEQRRILGALQPLLAQAEITCDILSRFPGLLKRFREAVLAAACSGRLTQDWREKTCVPTDSSSSALIDPTAALDHLPENVEFPQEWEISTLGKLVTQVQAGKNVRCAEHPPEAGQKGIIKISAVTWGNFREDESKTLEDPTRFMSERAIREGDLLISRANTIDLVGACTLVRRITRTLMLSDKVLRLEAPTKWKSWLLVCLRSPLGRFQIEDLATGNQLSMRNITQESLRRIVLPLPSPRERDEIVRRVDRLLGLADAIQKHVFAARQRSEKLTQSILAKTFRGELVPTEAELARRDGRKYEPASVLLERIRTDWASKSTPVIKKPKTRRVIAHV